MLHTPRAEDRRSRPTRPQKNARRVYDSLVYSLCASSWLSLRMKRPRSAVYSGTTDTPLVVPAQTSPHLSEVGSYRELVGCGVRLLHFLRRAPSVNLESELGEQDRETFEIQNQKRRGKASDTSLSEYATNSSHTTRERNTRLTPTRCGWYLPGSVANKDTPIANTSGNKHAFHIFKWLHFFFSRPRR